MPSAAGGSKSQSSNRRAGAPPTNSPPEPTKPFPKTDETLLKQARPYAHRQNHTGTATMQFILELIRDYCHGQCLVALPLREDER